MDPDALGTPVMNFAYLSAITAGYTKAGLYAFVGVAFLAFLAFRELRPTLLALIPLSVGAVWTLGLTALWQVPLNVGNLLFLPLVMGIGIDNGIMSCITSGRRETWQRTPYPWTGARARRSPWRR